MTTWAALFERADRAAVAVDDVRSALATHRADARNGDATDADE